MGETPPHTILIAEDEAHLRELVRAVLGPGYRYLEAKDGDEALRQLAEGPDLVVLDLMLPGTSGMSVLRALRNGGGGGNTPVVVVTAWSHAEKDVLAAGADRFLAKPFEPDVLRSTVTELLSGR